MSPTIIELLNGYFSLVFGIGTSQSGIYLLQGHQDLYFNTFNEDN
jgi:hypothetical protein